MDKPKFGSRISFRVCLSSEIGADLGGLNSDQVSRGMNWLATKGTSFKKRAKANDKMSRTFCF